MRAILAHKLRLAVAGLRLLVLTRERAKRAITPTGGVILAECEPLHEALYRPLPGTFTVSVTHHGREDPG